MIESDQGWKMKNKGRMEGREGKRETLSERTSSDTRCASFCLSSVSEGRGADLMTVNFSSYDVYEFLKVEMSFLRLACH